MDLQVTAFRYLSAEQSGFDAALLPGIFKPFNDTFDWKTIC
jgi:hypothetical protein